MLSKQKNYQTVAPDYIHLMPLLYKNSLEGPGNKHLQEVTARESTALFKMSIWQDMLAVCTWQTDHGSLDCTTPPPPSQTHWKQVGMLLQKRHCMRHGMTFCNKLNLPAHGLL